MGDRVALMRRGVLQQVDTPMRLYHAPANLFVASFIGSPAMNLFEAQLERRNGHLVAQIGDQFLRLAPEALADPGELERYVGRTVALGVRPEHIEDAALVGDAPSEPPAARVVRTVEALGSELIAHLELTGKPVHDRRGQGDRGRHSTPASSASWRPRSATPPCRSWRASTSRRARGRARPSRSSSTRARDPLLRPRVRRGDRRAPGRPRGGRVGGEGLTCDRQPAGGHRRHHRRRPRPAAARAALRHAPRHAGGAAVPARRRFSASSSSTPIRRCAAST